MKKAKSLWKKYGSDAVWEPYDNIDNYTIECNIFLDVDGYKFEGWGVICCGEKEVGGLDCTTPAGETFKLY